MSLSIAPPANRLIQAAQTLSSVGRIRAGQAPLEPARLNTRFDEIRALLRAAGYKHALEFAGYQARAYALYDPSRFTEVEVLRWLRDDLDGRIEQRTDCAPERSSLPLTCSLPAPLTARRCLA